MTDYRGAARADEREDGPERGGEMGIEASYDFRRVSDTVATSGVIAFNDLAGLREEGYE